MVSAAVGSTVFFAYLYLAVVSVPIALLSVTLAEFAGSVTRSVIYVVGMLASVTVLGTVSATASLGVGVVWPIVLTVVVEGIVICLLPVWVATVVGQRVAGHGRDRSLANAMIGWPVGLVGGLVVLASTDIVGAESLTAVGIGPRVVVGSVLGLAIVTPTVVGLIVGHVRREESRQAVEE